jgi:hypothetical protein
MQKQQQNPRLRDMIYLGSTQLFSTQYLMDFFGCAHQSGVTARMRRLKIKGLWISEKIGNKKYRSKYYPCANIAEQLKIK